MNRAYLEEDLGLVSRYFPGARSAILRTPFDLSVGPVDRAALLRDDTLVGEQDYTHPDWQGSLLGTT